MSCRRDPLEPLSDASLPRCLVSQAYKYVEELWKKKQSDVLRFLQRVRVWEYRQLPSVCRVTRPTRPDKAGRSSIFFFTRPTLNLFLLPSSSPHPPPPHPHPPPSSPPTPLPPPRVCTRVHPEVIHAPNSVELIRVLSEVSHALISVECLFPTTLLLGAPPGVQGQAGVLHLPRARAPRWPQAARQQSTLRWPDYPPRARFVRPSWTPSAADQKPHPVELLFCSLVHFQ